jgi:prolyl-tRNA synthetase
VDRKAIQAGTSHYLGQNFSKAQDISFTGRDGRTEFAHTTSWGVSTRLIGTLIMAHSDDDGLVLPPRVAPQHVVIVPVTPKEETREAVLASCQALAEMLRHQMYHGDPIRVHVDTRDLGGGVKKWEWIKKGVPIRIEIGPRDVETRKVCIQRRDQPASAKEFADKEDFLRRAGELLDEVHHSMLARAREFRDANLAPCSDEAAFEEHWTQDNPGWLCTRWAGSAEQEEEISKRLKITIRCLPLEGAVPAHLVPADDACFLTGKPGAPLAVWGRSY